MKLYTDNSGSEWRRWDLHIHTKGTNKNDCYTCANMEAYCELLFKKAIEKEVWAIGITDYFSIERYHEVKAYQHAIDSKVNFTPEEKEIVKKLFLLPNVELRMLPATSSGRLINIHCIFNPDFEKRLENDFFSSLSFKYDGNEYKMNRQGIIDLGKSIDDRLDDIAAYKKGIDQFTLSPDKLLDLFESKQDLRENTLVVVSNSNNDGVSGLQKHYDLFENESGSLDMVRKSIYNMSDCIFSPNSKDHDYFLGKRSDKPEVIQKMIRSLKPCIHGSDAHTEEKMFEPNEKRYCWIKADLTFNGLKQILYEPEERVRIQPSKPDVKSVYQVMDSISLNETGFWHGTIRLNPNLNTIIGGRSTGKSSLLKAIAAKHNSNKVKENDFIRQHLNGVSVHWSDGDDQLGRHIEYFPQSYMHDIAHDESRTNEIVESIIRQKDKAELLAHYEDTTSSLAKSITDSTFKLFQFQRDVDSLRTSITERGKKDGVIQQIALLKAQIAELRKSSSLSAEEQTVYEGLVQQLKEKQKEVLNAENDLKLFERLQIVTPIIPDFEDRYKFRELSYGLNQSEAYRLFQGLRVRTEMEFTATVKKLAESTIQAKQRIETEIQTIIVSESYKKGLQAFEGNKELNDLSKKQQEEENRLAEILRLEANLAVVTKQRDELLSKIVGDHLSVKTAAVTAVSQLPVSFGDVEIGVALSFKQKEFREFLESRLNMRGYARQDYIDELVNNYASNTELRIKEFLNKLLTNQIELKNSNTPQNVASEFLSSNWFKLNYSLSYQSDSFKNMSEGKQAFVILKLLLEFSNTTCPILIDQPEDSLDNRAIYNELVTYIKEKKRERQIILVTHNSNVVVSADAENIIVANQDGTGAHNLENNKFQYVNGALENSSPRNDTESVLLYSQGIREHVCEILEGGKDAFEKREKKYGFKMR